MAAKKRYLKDEHRVFNENWELQYFIISSKDKMVCLLCDCALTTLKKYNANQHYLSHKDHKYFNLQGEARKVALQKLKSEKQKQRQFFQAAIGSGNKATEATYRVAYILGKKCKPFADVQIVRDCIIEVVRCIDPDRVSKYTQLPLSRQTITERQHDLSRNIAEQLFAVLSKENIYFSIALDESTDCVDSAQVLYFIRVITEDFQCFEELLSMGTLTGRTRGLDISANFLQKCGEVGLNLQNLVNICTDGAPSMVGKHEGFIAQLKKVLPDPNAVIVFHCILHQQNLCAKSTVLSDTLQKVIAIVNYIRANATRHRQFRNMLKSDEEEFSVDLPYHCKVRWLSRGQVLEKMLSLREQIIKFYEECNEQCDLLDEEFHMNASFLCDVMSKQNTLNKSLQGETKSIYDMWQKIQAFRKKLLFLKNLLLRNDISAEHFPRLSEVVGEQDLQEVFQVYADVIDILIEQYNTRFADFQKHDLDMKLAFQPHLIEVSSAPTEFQMELIELSEDNIMKSLFNAKKDPLEIWRNAVEYPRLRNHARKILSCFSSTYCCESTFSFMNRIKTASRSQLTDTHLEDQLRLSTSKLLPNFEILSNRKHTQKSH